MIHWKWSHNRSIMPIFACREILCHIPSTVSLSTALLCVDICLFPLRKIPTVSCALSCLSLSYHEANGSADSEKATISAF
jgi:hypothetical protein